MLRHGHGAAASTTQTGPRANVIGWPDKVVNVVPPSASGRDQRMAYAWPPRSTTPVPVPVLTAYGGRMPASRNREVRTLVYWITTVDADSWPPSAARAGLPSIHTIQRPPVVGQRKVNDAA